MVVEREEERKEEERERGLTVFEGLTDKERGAAQLQCGVEGVWRVWCVCWSPGAVQCTVVVSGVAALWVCVRGGGSCGFLLIIGGIGEFIIIILVPVLIISRSVSVSCY